MAKTIRVTIEYSLEEGRLEGETDEQALNREALDWQEGTVSVPDFVDLIVDDPALGTLRFEVIGN